MSDSDSEQQSIDPFREMNRYDHRHEDWPSDAVFEPPRRTLENYWWKFHADRDCGAGKVTFLEEASFRTHGENHAYKLYCWSCKHRIPEDEVLFIGGDWYSHHGWQSYGRPLDSLRLPRDRVLELGPDPDRDGIEHALTLTRIERQAGPHVGGPIQPDQWSPCEDCGHDVPLLFDDHCRMCYDGEWTDRMQDSLDAYERKVREWHNDSFVHQLPQKVDPLSIKGRAFPDKILWRRHDFENVPKLVEVKQCLQDDRDGHWEYVLADMTNSREWRYHEEDLADCFWDTGLYNEESTKGVQDDRIREVYQRVCEHSFSEVHDPETNEVAGEQCIKCRKRRPLSAAPGDGGPADG